MIADISGINTAILKPTADIANRIDAKTMEKINQTAVDFEAVFLTEMLKPMFEGIETNAMFGGGKGEDVFRDFALIEHGKNMAKSSSIGIADIVREQMIRLQSANLPALNETTTLTTSPSVTEISNDINATIL